MFEHVRTHEDVGSHVENTRKHCQSHGGWYLLFFGCVCVLEGTQTKQITWGIVSSQHTKTSHITWGALVLLSLECTKCRKSVWVEWFLFVRIIAATAAARFATLRLTFVEASFFPMLSDIPSRQESLNPTVNPKP